MWPGMAFTVNDLHDLTRLLLDRPEWLSEVRRIVLTNELLALPDIVRSLVEAQRRTEERLDQLTVRVEQLAEAQRRTEERVEQLAEAQRRTEENLNRLAQIVHRLEIDMAEVRGIVLELRYREKAASYFGRWMRKPRVVDFSDIWDDMEQKLSPDEVRELSNVDLLVRGQLPREKGGGEVWLAIEVSGVVNKHDIERALERAELLRKAGLKAVPVVAGHSPLNTEIAEMIANNHVALLVNGSTAGWEEALQRALPTDPR